VEAHLLADIAAFATAGIAIIGGVSYFFLRKTKVTNEVIDGSVLAEFRVVLERVVRLELELALTSSRIEALEAQEEDLKKTIMRREERINLLERENEKLLARIEAHQVESDSLKQRISHLESVCRRAGINGGALDNPSDV